MNSIKYARHQFPPSIIQHAVWLYLRFSWSYRDVEDLLAERGLDLSYETVRRRVREAPGSSSINTPAAGQFSSLIPIRRGGPLQSTPNIDLTRK